MGKISLIDYRLNMNDVRKLLLIINPNAGAVSGRIGADVIIDYARNLTYCDEDMHTLNYDVSIAYTTGPGDATKLAAEAAADGFYGVIACGGDGTVNEVAKGVINSECIMGIIPLGSGNGLARHLGIPLTLKGAFGTIQEDRILHADYASANDRPFFCTFGVGFDAEVTDKFNLRPGRGLKNYILTALEEYFSYKSDTYTIIANGKRITEKALIVAVCNASQYGNNAYIAPHASIKDGLLDITVVHNGSLMENALSAIELLSGMIGKTAFSTTFQASELKIQRNHEGPAHFDGEPAFLSSHINVKCHRGGLKLFSTSRKSRNRAFMSPEIPFISPLVLTLRDLGFRIQNLIPPKAPEGTGLPQKDISG